jgi:hypothetical protein
MLDLLPSRGFLLFTFYRGLPRLALKLNLTVRGRMKKNGDWLCCPESPDFGKGIHQRNCYSAGNYQIMY